MLASFVVVHRAFGFSACVNISAFAVLKSGDDYGPSIFLFVYVGWIIWAIIWAIQARYFPDPAKESSEYAFLRSPNPDQRLQISMTMRTEFILRALDLMSDAIFFFDGALFLAVCVCGCRCWLT